MNTGGAGALDRFYDCLGGCWLLTTADAHTSHRLLRLMPEIRTDRYDAWGGPDAYTADAYQALHLMALFQLARMRLVSGSWPLTRQRSPPHQHCAQGRPGQRVFSAAWTAGAGTR